MSKTLQLMVLMTVVFSGSLSEARAAGIMEPATLDSPSGIYVSAAPRNVDLTWNNTPISFVNSSIDEYGDEFASVEVLIGEETLSAKSYIMSSIGMPGDKFDTDLWYLEVALYEVEELKGFSGESFTISLPEGIVQNKNGEINPAQNIEFKIVGRYNEFSVTPEDGSKIPSSNPLVKMSFGGYPLEYLQSSVRALTYGRMFKDMLLENGTQVKIEDTEILIDLTGLDNALCEVRVPEGFVLVDVDGVKYLSPEIWLEFTIVKQTESGIDGVAAEDDSEFYTIEGMKIKGDCRDLPRGIYIKNGKKILNLN